EEPHHLFLPHPGGRRIAHMFSGGSGDPLEANPGAGPRTNPGPGGLARTGGNFVFKGLISGLSRWLENEDSKKRRAPRLVEPALVVYYWDGSVPEGRRIRDISSSGAYVVTPERWYIGTIVRLILQGYKTTPQPGGGIVSSRSTSIPCRVVRHAPDGI